MENVRERERKRIGRMIIFRYDDDDVIITK